MWVKNALLTKKSTRKLSGRSKTSDAACDTEHPTSKIHISQQKQNYYYEFPCTQAEYTCITIITHAYNDISAFNSPSELRDVAAYDLTTKKKNDGKGRSTSYAITPCFALSLSP